MENHTRLRWWWRQCVGEMMAYKPGSFVSVTNQTMLKYCTDVYYTMRRVLQFQNCITLIISFLLRCTQHPAPMGRPQGKPSRFTFSSGTQLDRRGGLRFYNWLHTFICAESSFIELCTQSCRSSNCLAERRNLFKGVCHKSVSPEIQRFPNRHLQGWCMFVG